MPRCLFFEWAHSIEARGRFPRHSKQNLPIQLPSHHFQHFFGLNPFSPNSKSFNNPKCERGMQHWHEKTDFSGSSCPEPLAVRRGNAPSAVEAKHPMTVARKPSRPPRTQEFNTGVQLITAYPKSPSGPPGTLLHNG